MYAVLSHTEAIEGAGCSSAVSTLAVIAFAITAMLRLVIRTDPSATTLHGSIISLPTRAGRSGVARIRMTSVGLRGRRRADEHHTVAEALEQVRGRRIP